MVTAKVSGEEEMSISRVRTEIRKEMRSIVPKEISCIDDLPYSVTQFSSFRVANDFAVVVCMRPLLGTQHTQKRIYKL